MRERKWEQKRWGNKTERRSQREMRRCSSWQRLQTLEDSCQSRGISPEKLWQAQTRAHFPEEIWPMGKPEQRKSVRRNEQWREIVKCCLCPQFSLCWSGRDEPGMKLSLRKEGRKVVLMLVFFPTTQTSYYIFILIGNKSSPSRVCLQQ